MDHYRYEVEKTERVIKEILIDALLKSLTLSIAFSPRVHPTAGDS